MMENDSTETVSIDGNLHTYIQQNLDSSNTQLFSVLALLKAYVPDSYLSMQVCQHILGPPDPIDGGPPFEERMEPFTDFINTATAGQVCMCQQDVAQRMVEELDTLGIKRSSTAEKLLPFLRGGEQPDLGDMIKNLLVKRETTVEGKERFSRLIIDILAKESHCNAVSVLNSASERNRQIAIYPQTIARLYYIEEKDYEEAAKWAKKAINVKPLNSFVADTLGQVCKNRLRKACDESNDCAEKYKNNAKKIQQYANEAFKAFKDVEKKAMQEEDPENEDLDGTVRTSVSFNNRGHFGFIQVAKIVFKRLGKTEFTNELIEEVEEKFEFFEWYLTYSVPDMTTLEPPYFWKDIALCYERYTGGAAAMSTSFPGLLDFLNHGRFPPRRKQAGGQRTTEELQVIVDDPNIAYQAKPGNVIVAMRYILSNIILCNMEADAPQHAPLKELQSAIRRFFNQKPTPPPQPEFHLLALMLFWPEEQLQEAQQEADSEVERQAAEGDEQEEEAILPPDLQQHVKFMKNAFDGIYAKYLRGRYLVPLFFLGKGRGLDKWIHKSRLDAIVEKEVESELTEANDRTKTEKMNEMWRERKVWEIQNIRDLLLPVQVEAQQIPEALEVQEVSVRVGGKELQAKLEDESPQSSELSYLYFTIEGPVVVNV